MKICVDWIDYKDEEVATHNKEPLIWVLITKGHLCKSHARAFLK